MLDRIFRDIDLDTRTGAYGATLLRVALGTMFLAHGLYLKVFVFTMAGTVGFFDSLGLPAIAAWGTVTAETLGGLALILGFKTRAVSLALVPVLLGATMVHVPNGWLFTSQGGGWEYPVFLIVAALVQALLGDGVLSVSNALRNHNAVVLAAK